MRDFVKEVTTNVSALESLIGAENVEDVKKRIADIIVQTCQNEIDANREEYYIFYPPDYTEEIIGEAVDEVKNKLKKMYKDALLEAATASVEKFKVQMSGGEGTVI